MPNVVTMKFQRLLQVLLVQPASKAQGDASIVCRSSQWVELVEVGIVGEFHHEVRVHSCD